MPRLRQRSTSAAWSPRVAYGRSVNKLIRGAFGNVPSNPEAAVLAPKSVVPQSFMDAVTKTADGDAEGAMLWVPPARRAIGMTTAALSAWTMS